jgi:signal transduction histidine kinase
MHTPLALLDAKGQRIAASRRYLDLEAEGHGRPLTVPLEDGRQLLIMRPDLRMLPLRRLPPEVEASGPQRGEPMAFPEDRLPPGLPGADRGPGGPGGDRPQLPPPGFLLGPGGEWPASLGLVVLLAMLFIAVAAGAYPVVRSITGRLERLKHGVEAFGAGALAQRVQEEGKDEVAALAASFNRAAQRIQSLVQSNQSLLANASHELRSPLARLKMALSMMDDAAPAQRAALRKEIEVNIRELDALVEEVLLSSRLEAGVAVDLDDPVDALAVMAEEASRVDAQVEGPPLMLRGSERLLRRAVRNLLENARRYGGQDVQAELALQPSARSSCGFATAARVCPRLNASGSSSPSTACPAMPSARAAWAWGWRWSARSPCATKAACTANSGRAAAAASC